MTTNKESKQTSCGRPPAHEFLKCYCGLAKTPGELVKMIAQFGINVKFNSFVALQMSQDDTKFEEGKIVHNGFDTADGFGRKFNLFMYDELDCFDGNSYYNKPICCHPIDYLTIFTGHAQQLALRIRPETEEYAESYEGFRNVVEYDLIICRACKCACVVYRMDTTINEDWDPDEGDLNFIPEQIIAHARKSGKEKKEKFETWLKSPNPTTYRAANEATPPPPNSPMDESDSVKDKPQIPEAKL